jgi:hypothetical protein
VTMIASLAVGGVAMARGDAAAQASSHRRAKHHHHHTKHHARPVPGIPQHNGGDHDADNNGGPNDGDGSV